MWHNEIKVESNPTFPYSAPPHGHHLSHSYTRTSVSGSGSRENSLKILHPPNDCTHCQAYKIHLLYACLQDDAALGRDWTEMNPEHGESILGFSSDVPRELSQVRSILRRVTRERDDATALNARYRNEVTLLESQLREAKDRLLAIEIAYADENHLHLLDEESRTDGFLREEIEQDDNSESSLSPSNDSLDEDIEMDDFWSPVIQTGVFGTESWNDSMDEFDVFQQLHLMTQEDENPCDESSSNALQNPPHNTTNSTLPMYLTDSSSSSPFTSSSSLSASDWTGDQSDDSSSSQPTSSDAELRRILKLMASAHEGGNTAALVEIRKLIVKSERTPRHRRTNAQKYLLLNWRSPSFFNRNNCSSSASTQPQSVPPAHPSPSERLEIFVDASGSGIGFVFGKRWLAWTFKNTPKIPLGGDGHIVMSWAELLAVEVGLRALIAAGYRSTSIIVRSDNTGVIDALKKKSWCPRHGIEEILQKILKLCGEYGIKLKPSWVSTTMNPADLPSRGVFPPSSLAFEFPPQLPARLSDLLQLAVPATA